MKILMIAASYFPSDVRIYKEAKTLRDAGHEVHVVCFKEDKPKEIDGIKVHRFPFLESSLPSPLNWVVDYLLYWFFSLLYGYYYLIALRARVIHFHNPPDFPVPFFLPARAFGVRLVFDVHDPTHVLAETQLRGLIKLLVVPVLKFFFLIAVKSVSVVITVSKSVAELIPRECIIVPNCPGEEFFREKYLKVKPEPNTAIYVGAMVKHRGLEELVKAMSKVNGKLLMVGDGPLLKSLSRLAPSNVEFTGYKPHSEIPSLVARSAVAVLPFEPNPINIVGSPNKLYEYMALGKPVVCTDLPGARAIGKDAALFVECSEEGFARGINKLFKDKKLAARLGKKARKIAMENYRWSKAKMALIELYKKLGNS